MSVVVSGFLSGTLGVMQITYLIRLGQSTTPEFHAGLCPSFVQENAPKTHGVKPYFY
jgi:hypothetical protein